MRNMKQVTGSIRFIQSTTTLWATKFVMEMLLGSFRVRIMVSMYVQFFKEYTLPNVQNN